MQVFFQSQTIISLDHFICRFCVLFAPCFQFLSYFFCCDIQRQNTCISNFSQDCLRNRCFHTFYCFLMLIHECNFCFRLAEFFAQNFSNFFLFFHESTTTACIQIFVIFFRKFFRIFGYGHIQMPVGVLTHFIPFFCKVFHIHSPLILFLKYHNRHTKEMPFIILNK